MKPFTITNEHLTEIARSLGKEFNKIDFLLWYESNNSKFKYDNNHMKRVEQLNKYFEGRDENIVVRNLPNLEVNDEEKFKKLLTYHHGFFRDALSNVLEKHFNINYWDELLNIASNKENKVGYATYYSLFSHCINDVDFNNRSIEPIKKMTDNLIDSVNKSKNKQFTEILQFMSHTIDCKDLYENDWIVRNLNEIFKESNNGSSKQFNFYVDKISKKFEDLDFSKIRVNQELKKVLKGKVPLKKTPIQCIPYFWEIDLPRYTVTQKVVQQLLQTNCITGLDLINKFLQQEDDVLSSFVKREKNIMSLTVLHENEHLNEKLDILLDTILNKTKLNLMLDKDDFENAILYVDLNKAMPEKPTGSKRAKI